MKRTQLKSKYKPKPTKEILLHRSRVSELGCMLSGRPNPTLHHCKSGSMTEVAGLKGGGQKTSEWLIIGLDHKYHLGEYGIDSGYGVLSWERDFEPQVELLDRLCVALSVNVWAKCGIQRDISNIISSTDLERWME